MYWIHFQNIHTFIYHKTLLHTLFYLFLKSSKTFIVSLTIEILWSSHLKVFYKKGVLKIFAKFTGKNLCHSLFFNKVISQAWNLIKKETPTQLSFCKYCELFKNTFLWNISDGCNDTFFEIKTLHDITILGVPFNK